MILFLAAGSETPLSRYISPHARKSLSFSFQKTDRHPKWNLNLLNPTEESLRRSVIHTPLVIAAGSQVVFGGITFHSHVVPREASTMKPLSISPRLVAPIWVSQRDKILARKEKPTNNKVALFLLLVGAVEITISMPWPPNALSEADAVKIFARRKSPYPLPSSRALTRTPPE